MLLLLFQQVSGGGGVVEQGALVLAWLQNQQICC
jgi:hypothetical protein